MFKNKNLIQMVVVVSTIMFTQSTYSAQIATDPHDYTVLPKGTNLALLYTQFTDHNEFFADGQKVENGPTLDTKIGLLRGIHYTKFKDIPINLQAVIPFGDVKLGTAQGEVSNSGIGDPIVGISFWPYDNPEKKRTLGGSAFISIPVGQYSSEDGPVNIGENRYKLILQGAYQASLTKKISIGVVGEYTFFGDNDDFGGAKREQEDQFGIQLHLNRDFSPKKSLSLSYYHDFGAESTVGGVKQNDELNNSSVHVTYKHFVKPDTQVLVEYGRSIDVKNGFFENDRINLRFLKVF